MLAMQILAFGGIIRSLEAAVGPFFDAIGPSEVNTELPTINPMMIAIFIYSTAAQRRLQVLFSSSLKIF
jgi:hypothetical protein